jgi:hypothetical protein
MTDNPKLKIARGHLYLQIRAGLVEPPPGYAGREELQRRARPRIEAELRRLGKQLERERMAMRPIGEAASRVAARLAERFTD